MFVKAQENLEGLVGDPRSATKTILTILRISQMAAEKVEPP